MVKKTEIMCPSHWEDVYDCHTYLWRQKCFIFVPQRMFQLNVYRCAQYWLGSCSTKPRKSCASRNDSYQPLQSVWSLPPLDALWVAKDPNLHVVSIWASSWDYGTYHIGDQRRLRRVCASAQSRQSLHCSHTWSMEVYEGSDQKSEI